MTVIAFFVVLFTGRWPEGHPFADGAVVRRQFGCTQRGLQDCFVEIERLKFHRRCIEPSNCVAEAPSLLDVATSQLGQSRHSGDIALREVA